MIIIKTEFKGKKSKFKQKIKCHVQERVTLWIVVHWSLLILLYVWLKEERSGFEYRTNKQMVVNRYQKGKGER